MPHNKRLDRFGSASRPRPVNRSVSPQSNCLATIRFSSGFARQRQSTASDPLYLRMKYVDASGIGQGDLTRRASVLAHWSWNF